MKITVLKDHAAEIQSIRHALRIGATADEYRECVRSLSSKIVFECPSGEAIGNLAGFAWAWKMRGLMHPQPITKADRFNAQGLEGKVSIPCTLYEALFYAVQADPNRVQFVHSGKR